MPVATDIMKPLWRGVVALRVLTAAFAIGSILVHHDGFSRPGAGWTLLAGIAVWTVLSCVAYSYDGTRRMHVIVIDLLVTLGILASSAVLLSAEQLSAVTAGTPLLIGVWACGPVVAAGVHAGRFAGVLFAVAVTAVDVWVRGSFTADVARDAVLLVGTGFVFGLAATTARWATEQLHRAARAEVATAERERVARSIHDSVLRVLSGAQAGDGQLNGAAAELSRLAGEQEIALRSLVTAAAPGAAIGGEADLAAALQTLAGGQVEISVPAAVPLPAGDVAELVALTREALAGTGAQAGSWVSVDDLGHEVVLTVRTDAGPELSPAVRGRAADLGAVLTRNGPTWQLRLTRTHRPVGGSSRATNPPADSR
jgi:signal transduction histidine kinase